MSKADEEVSLTLPQDFLVIFLSCLKESIENLFNDLKSEPVLRFLESEFDCGGKK